MKALSALQMAKQLLTVNNFFAENGLPAEAARLLAGVKEVATQKQVVAAFSRAASHYDDGHRPDEGTTMDVMLDEVFPKYGSTALLALLRKFSLVGYLVTDRFSDLFAPALKRLDAPTHRRALEQLYLHMFDEALDGPYPEVELLSRSLKRTTRQLSAGTRARVRLALEKAKQGQRAEQSLDAQLEAANAAQFEALARREGRTLWQEHFWSAGRATHRLLKQLPFALFAEFARDELNTTKNVHVLAPLLGYAFMSDVKAATAWVAATGEVHGGPLSKALGDLERWALEQRGQVPQPAHYLDTLVRHRTAFEALQASKRALDERDPVRRAQILQDEAFEQYEQVSPAKFGALVRKWAQVPGLDEAWHAYVYNNARRDVVRQHHQTLPLEALEAEVAFGLAHLTGASSGPLTCDSYAIGDALSALLLRSKSRALAMIQSVASQHLQPVLEAIIVSTRDADGVNAAFAAKPELLQLVSTAIPEKSRGGRPR